MWKMNREIGIFLSDTFLDDNCPRPSSSADEDVGSVSNPEIVSYDN